MIHALLLAIALAGQIEPVTPHAIVLTEMPATIIAPLGANDYTWFTPPGIIIEIGDEPHQLTFTATTGTYQIRCKTLTIDWDAKTLTPKTHIATFIVGTPSPDPDPDPDPDPTPGDAPFPSPGLAVLVIEEAQDRQNLPASQRAIWTDTSIRQYLRNNCADEDGRILQAFWDDDFVSGQLSGMPSTFRNAYPKIVVEAKGNLPWVAISNGTTGYSGPLPGNVDDFMALLRKYTPASELHRTLSDLRALAR